MGGGVCVVYQVGVLKVLVEIVCEVDLQWYMLLFVIVCGLLVGVINVMLIVSYVDDFFYGVCCLFEFWELLCVDYVYCIDWFGIVVVGVCWFVMMMFGWVVCCLLCGLFDNMLFVYLLQCELSFYWIEQMFEVCLLYVFVIIVFSYLSGWYFIFYQVVQLIQVWWCVQCIVWFVDLLVLYLFVLLVILFVFFVVLFVFDGQIEYFGDGLIWQIVLLLLVIYFGVDWIVVIGVVDLWFEILAVNGVGWVCGYLMFVQIGQQVFVSVFFDLIGLDIEWIEYINWMIEYLLYQVEVDSGWWYVDVFVIVLFECIELIVVKYLKQMLVMMCGLFGVIGGSQLAGVLFVSYLLFEEVFMCELIEFGYCDGWVQCEMFVGWIVQVDGSSVLVVGMLLEDGFVIGEIWV